ncbi:MAG: hypothetical protein JRF20_01540 [Deltaproteobacteria bacterium]|nr:hypothetical protein [Deltaproteobacteria bacterium]
MIRVRAVSHWRDQSARRYGRHGYLYQNRYKSILCQEDEYLLELVRYIHLNPVRVGVVNSFSKLDRYRWWFETKRRWLFIEFSNSRMPANGTNSIFLKLCCTVQVPE